MGTKQPAETHRPGGMPQTGGSWRYVPSLRGGVTASEAGFPRRWAERVIVKNSHARACPTASRPAAWRRSCSRKPRQRAAPGSHGGTSMVGLLRGPRRLPCQRPGRRLRERGYATIERACSPGAGTLTARACEWWAHRRLMAPLRATRPPTGPHPARMECPRGHEARTDPDPVRDVDRAKALYAAQLGPRVAT